MRTKKKVINAYVVKNKKFDNPWTLKMANTEKGAWEIFEEIDESFKFGKDNFEVVPCLITLLPNKSLKAKGDKK